MDANARIDHFRSQLMGELDKVRKSLACEIATLREQVAALERQNGELSRKVHELSRY